MGINKPKGSPKLSPQEKRTMISYAVASIIILTAAVINEITKEETVAKQVITVAIPSPNPNPHPKTAENFCMPQLQGYQSMKQDFKEAISRINAIEKTISLEFELLELYTKLSTAIISEDHQEIDNLFRKINQLKEQETPTIYLDHQTLATAESHIIELSRKLSQTPQLPNLNEEIKVEDAFILLSKISYTLWLLPSFSSQTLVEFTSIVTNISQYYVKVFEFIELKKLLKNKKISSEDYQAREAALIASQKQKYQAIQEARKKSHISGLKLTFDHAITDLESLKTVIAELSQVDCNKE